jgi:hypothetical protein
MQTTINSTSRPSGVHLIRNTTRHNVTMLTTGKTLGENHIYSTTMLMSYARIGKRALSLVSTRRVVSFRQLV